MPIAPRYLDTLPQAKFDTTNRVISGGISESQPIMGTSGSHVNNEKVFVDSGGGHYTSDGKYHFDSDGDGKMDETGYLDNAYYQISFIYYQRGYEQAK